MLMAKPAVPDSRAESSVKLKHNPEEEESSTWI